MGLFGNKPEVPAYSAERPITASAARLNLRDKTEVEANRKRSTNQAWQAEAWQYFDAVGEIKFGFGVLASVLSRLRVYPAVVIDADAPPVSVSDAAEIERPDSEDGDTESISGEKSSDGLDPRLALIAKEMWEKAIGKTSIPTLLRMYALNMSVPGECYLVQMEDRWWCKSTSEIVVDGTGQLTYQPSGAGGLDKKVLEKSTPIGRVWREHPRFSKDPDSSMRGVLADCEELLLAGKMIRSGMRSRLSAGILFIPDSVSAAARTPTDDVDEDADQEDALEKELIFAMTEPVRDETSASSIVPLILRGPDEAADKINFTDLVRKNDEHLISRSDRALERILQGIDIPKDIVTGLANVKYSNAIQIDENMYKAHIEPLALLLVDALTEIIYRPMLRADPSFPSDEVDRMVMWFDPSEITTKPNQDEDAQFGYSNYLLSGGAWRQAHGYSDTDAPDEEELARRVALEKAAVPPEVAQALFQRMLPEILGEAREANDEASPAPLPESLQQALEPVP